MKQYVENPRAPERCAGKMKNKKDAVKYKVSYQVWIRRREKQAELNAIEISTLLIHAQDHFMIAMEVITMVERMIKLYKIIFKEIDEKNNKLLSM